MVQDFHKTPALALLARVHGLDSFGEACL